MYVTGSPMAEVLHQNLAEIEKSDILEKLGLEPQKYILLSAHREENIDTEKNFLSLFTAMSGLQEALAQQTWLKAAGWRRRSWKRQY